MTFRSPSPVPDTVDIRAALDRVTGSAEFRASLQLVAFLRFIVETSLSGGADRLKAYTIGTEALGRGSDFDPQGDPIVRVEAQRLRRTLSAYYAGGGADDPIIIDVPRGGYVPSFRHRLSKGDGQGLPQDVASPGRRMPRLFVPLAAMVVLIAAVAAVAVVLRIPPMVEAAPPEPGSVSIEAVPTILIEPIQAMAGSASSLAADLRRELADELGHVQAITVMAVPLTSKTQDTGNTRPGAAGTYRLTGIVDSQGDGVAIVTLRLVADGTIAWTRDWRVADGAPSVEVISREAAIDIVAFSGIMLARLRAQSNTLSPGYRCLLAAVDSLRKFDLTQQDSIRDCLERTAERNPNLALAFAMLAFVYERE